MSRSFRSRLRNSSTGHPRPGSRVAAVSAYRLRRKRSSNSWRISVSEATRSDTSGHDNAELPRERLRVRERSQATSRCLSCARRRAAGLAFATAGVCSSLALKKASFCSLHVKNALCCSRVQLCPIFLQQAPQMSQRFRLKWPHRAVSTARTGRAAGRGTVGCTRLRSTRLMRK